MIETIIASDINRKYGLVAPPQGTQCFIIINETQRVEMVCKPVNGKINGVAWFFICPVTGKLCRKLYLDNSIYQHRAAIKGFHHKIRPAWYFEGPLYQLLVKEKKCIDAEKLLNSKHFKTHRNGKPTKKYLECKKLLEETPRLDESKLINGYYDGIISAKSREMFEMKLGM